MFDTDYPIPKWSMPEFDRLIICHPDDSATALEAADLLRGRGDIRSVVVYNGVPSGTMYFMPDPKNTPEWDSPTLPKSPCDMRIVSKKYPYSIAGEDFAVSYATLSTVDAKERL
jgi:hypothetical protein